MAYDRRHEEMMSAGRRIKALRKVMGDLTQESFGKMVRVSQSNISHFERGDRMPTYEVARRIASRVGVTAAWILEDSALGMDPDMLIRLVNAMGNEKSREQA